MDIIVECNCGKELDIRNVSVIAQTVTITTEECSECEALNYEAGESDAKEHG